MYNAYVLNTAFVGLYLSKHYVIVKKSSVGQELDAEDLKRRTNIVGIRNADILTLPITISEADTNNNTLVLIF
jgi:hypothetical protein